MSESHSPRTNTRLCWLAFWVHLGMERTHWEEGHLLRAQFRANDSLLAGGVNNTSLRNHFGVDVTRYHDKQFGGSRMEVKEADAACWRTVSNIYDS